MVDKNWYIVPTKKIVNILINKRGGGFNCNINQAVLLGKNDSILFWENKKNLSSEYIEINFNEFRKLVLKEQSIIELW
jgi:hypothetical protein